MSKFIPLFSSSKGNCTYYGNSRYGVLIDAGVSAKRTLCALAEHDIEQSAPQAVFVTHEHSDHIGGIRVLASKLHIPVYMTAGTYESMDKNGMLSEKVDYRVFENFQQAADFNITNFKTSHDTPESCGYVVDNGKFKVAVCTDLGYVSDGVHNAIKDCRLVMLESNHDIMMLQNNMNYPYPLKKRILSNSGHLSNNSSAQEITELAKCGVTRFVLAHLSQDNNMPRLAAETTKAAMYLEGFKQDNDYTLNVALPFDNNSVIV